MQAAPIRLRPHHFLCMLTFVGKGYSPAFVANMQQIVQRIRQGAAIELVEGPDDVCRPLLSAPDVGENPPHCGNPSVTARDARALADIAATLGGPPRQISATILTQLQKTFADGTVRPACAGCPWHSLCDDIAATGFIGTVLAQ